MKNSIANSLLDKLKVEKLSYLFSGRVYHSNSDCQVKRNLSQKEIFTKKAKGGEVRLALWNLEYYHATYDFKKRCAEYLLQELIEVSNEDEYEKTIGIIITKESSVDKDNSINTINPANFAALMYQNQYLLVKHYANQNKLADLIFDDICGPEIIPSTTSISYLITNTSIQKKYNITSSAMKQTVTKSTKYVSAVNTKSAYLTSHVSLSYTYDLPVSSKVSLNTNSHLAITHFSSMILKSSDKLHYSSSLSFNDSTTYNKKNSHTQSGISQILSSTTNNIFVNRSILKSESTIISSSSVFATLYEPTASFLSSSLKISTKLTSTINRRLEKSSESKAEITSDTARLSVLKLITSQQIHVYSTKLINTRRSSSIIDINEINFSKWYGYVSNYTKLFTNFCRCVRL